MANKTIYKKISLSNSSMCGALYTRDVDHWDSSKQTVFENFSVSNGYESVSLNGAEARKLADFIIKTLETFNG